MSELRTPEFIAAILGAFGLVMAMITLGTASPAIAQGQVQMLPMAPTKPSEPAPGRGVDPNVSAHGSLPPVLFTLDEQPVEHVSPLIDRQYMNGAQSTFVKWTMRKGAVVPLHHHPNEQITWIVKGQAEVYTNGRKYVMNAGDVMIIPANTPHEFVINQDTIDIDIFAPQRQDWIEGAANYLHR